MNNIKIVITLVLFHGFSSCSPIKKLYVPFSEAKQLHAQSNDNITRIYFDRMGFVYPDLQIPYDDFKNNDGRLNLYYARNYPKYEVICRTNGIVPLQANFDTIAPNEDPLQEYLLSSYANQINNLSEEKEVVFIIHGFNEYPLNRRDSSSFAEMKETRDTMETLFKGRKFKYVEVYWDGLSQEGGPKLLRYPNSFKIWNNAQVSATHVGLELRRLLNKLNSHKIYVITHSHGAGVITTSLFNVIKFRPHYYEQQGHWLNEVNKKFNSKIYNTPSQRFIVGMLAPAIPGQNVFDEYYHRTVNGKNVITCTANYKFLIGFNENDPVNLKFKVAASKLGSTTLGCKSKELIRTENLFRNREIFGHVDFSKKADLSKQDNHSWFEYLRNSPPIDNFLKDMFL
jgi:hypothetical protein